MILAETEIMNPENKNAHVPVMSREALEYLQLKNGDVVVDATLGLGGHRQTRRADKETQQNDNETLTAQGRNSLPAIRCAHNLLCAIGRELGVEVQLSVGPQNEGDHRAWDLHFHPIGFSIATSCPAAPAKEQRRLLMPRSQKHDTARSRYGQKMLP